MNLGLKFGESLALVALGLFVLISLTQRRYSPPFRHSREAVLKTDLRAIRDAIDNYTLEKKLAPHSLQDLVDAGYLRSIPVDPITHKADWIEDLGVPVLGDPVLSPELKAEGLVDVHSNSNQISHDGTKYRK